MQYQIMVISFVFLPLYSIKMAILGEALPIILQSWSLCFWNQQSKENGKTSRAKFNIDFWFLCSPLMCMCAWAGARLCVRGGALLCVHGARLRVHVLLSLVCGWSFLNKNNVIIPGKYCIPLQLPPSSIAMVSSSLLSIVSSYDNCPGDNCQGRQLPRHDNCPGTTTAQVRQLPRHDNCPGQVLYYVG